MEKEKDGGKFEGKVAEPGQNLGTTLAGVDSASDSDPAPLDPN